MLNSHEYLHTTSTFNPPNVSFDDDIDSDGLRTLPELVEYNARVNGNYTFAFQAYKGEGHSEDTLHYHQLSHELVGAYVKHCLVWFQQHVQLDRTDFVPNKIQAGPPKPRPVALLMDSDVTYFSLMVAIIAQGIPILFLSVKLNNSSISALLAEVSAQVVITSTRLQKRAQEAVGNLSHIQNSTTCSVVCISTAAIFEALKRGRPATEESKFESADISYHWFGKCDRNVAIFHSSGTTGTPKAIYHGHGYILKYGTCGHFRDDQRYGLNVSTLPLFHGYGLIPPLFSLIIGKPCCFIPSNVIASGTVVHEILDTLPVRSLMTVPSILEEVANIADGNGIKALAKLDFVASGGGPLVARLGDKLSEANVPIVNSFGVTELGGLSVMHVPDANHDWQYFRLRKDLDLEIRPLPHQPDPALRYSLAAVPIDGMIEFALADVFERNNSSEELDFKGVGRNDSLMVLSTGQKFSPDKLESKLVGADDSIGAAIMFGNNRVEVGWLIEPAAARSDAELLKLKQDAWFLISNIQYNEQHFAKLWTPDLIVVAPPGQRLPRSDKGSVMRHEAYLLFAKDIEQAYKVVAGNAESDSMNALDMADLNEGVRESVKMFLASSNVAEDIDDDADLFELGLDSLLALQLSRYLSARRPVGFAAIDSSFIYRHPTVRKIATALGGSEGNVAATTFSTEAKKLISEFSVIPEKLTLSNDSRNVLLLTGATGSLGAHILAAASKNEAVKSIICLNRKHKGDPVLTLQKSLLDKHLTLSPQAWQKVKVYESNLSTPLLGLTQHEYNDLIVRVTHIMHCAWPMDFKLLFPSFAAQYRILQNIIGLAHHCSTGVRTRKPRLLFVSSIAVVNQCHRYRDGGPVAEASVNTDDVTDDLGYGKAKLICESILRQASTRSESISISIARVGQISGSSATAYWNTHEHIPALFQISSQIGAMPRIPGTFSWLPVDVTAMCLCELLFTENNPTLYYHVESPIRQPWADLTNDISEVLGLSTSETVSFDEWLTMLDGLQLDKHAPSSSVQLKDFFGTYFRSTTVESSVVLDTSNAQQISETLRTCQRVSKDTLINYARQLRKM